MNFLKTQSVSQVMVLMFKVDIRAIHHTSKVEWCSYVQATFATLTVLSLVIPITISFCHLSFEPTQIFIR